MEKHLDKGIQEQGNRQRAVEEEEEEEEDRSSTKRIPIAQTEHVCISMSPAAVALPAARSSPTREPEGSGPLNLNSQGHTESLLAAAFPVEFGR